MTAASAALAGALAALLLLAGCATPPPPAHDWTSGRLSVRVDGASETGGSSEGAASGNQGFAAAFELRGSGDAGELRLLTPLGMQWASARWSGRGAVLVTADGERRFDTLDEMALASLGERVPLAALPDWVAGRPWSGAPSRPRAQGFEQLGWQVDTSAQGDGRISARRAAPPAVTVRIRLDRPAS